MPWTAVTWIIGAAALAGIPPLAGFFSKDAVVASVWHANPLAGLMLIAASALTAFYVARATRLAFFGEWRGDGHAHESPWSMRGPLLLLALLAAGLGFLATPFAEFLGHEGEAFDIPILVVSVLVAVFGVAQGGWSCVGERPVTRRSSHGSARVAGCRERVGRGRCGEARRDPSVDGDRPSHVRVRRPSDHRRRRRGRRVCWLGAWAMRSPVFRTAMPSGTRR